MTSSLTSDEREQRLKQIREWKQTWLALEGYAPKDFKKAALDHVDFLLSLLDSQAAGSTLAEQVVNSCLCAEPAGDCEESAAVHVPDLIRAISALPASQWSALCEQHRDGFNVFHVGGCLGCWNDSERESVATACVEKVKAMGQQWYGEAKKRGAAFSDKGRIAEMIVKELQSLTLDQVERKP